MPLVSKPSIAGSEEAKEREKVLDEQETEALTELKTVLSLGPTARKSIYILSYVGSLVATYLGAKGLIGADEIALWTGLSAGASGLAAAKTKATKQVAKK